MTEDGAVEPAGFVVSFFPTTASLQQMVDGTDVIPEKAEPLLIKGVLLPAKSGAAVPGRLSSPLM